MNVETILRTKGRAVATIGPDETVGAAVDQLISRNIGAIVVSKDGESVDGIISERDVVHALAARGTDLLSLKVAEVMTQRGRIRSALAALVHRRCVGPHSSSTAH